jgi:hypothetical protein
MSSARCFRALVRRSWKSKNRSNLFEVPTTPMAVTGMVMTTDIIRMTEPA